MLLRRSHNNPRKMETPICAFGVAGMLSRDVRVLLWDLRDGFIGSDDEASSDDGHGQAEGPGSGCPAGCAASSSPQQRQQSTAFCPVVAVRSAAAARAWERHCERVVGSNGSMPLSELLALLVARVECYDERQLGFGDCPSEQSGGEGSKGEDHGFKNGAVWFEDSSSLTATNAVATPLPSRWGPPLPPWVPAPALETGHAASVVANEEGTAAAASSGGHNDEAAAFSKFERAVRKLQRALWTPQTHGVRGDERGNESGDESGEDGGGGGDKNGDTGGEGLESRVRAHGLLEISLALAQLVAPPFRDHLFHWRPPRRRRRCGPGDDPGKVLRREANAQSPTRLEPLPPCSSPRGAGSAARPQKRAPSATAQGHGSGEEPPAMWKASAVAQDTSLRCLDLALGCIRKLHLTNAAQPI